MSDPNNNGSDKYLLRRYFWQSLSITLPLIMIGLSLDLSMWICLLPSIIYLPLIIRSVALFGLIEHTYNLIARPGLYIWGLVLTIQGEQDYIAIVFYILTGLQIISIVKWFVFSVTTLLSFFSKSSDDGSINTNAKSKKPFVVIAVLSVLLVISLVGNGIQYYLNMPTSGITVAEKNYNKAICYISRNAYHYSPTCPLASQNSIRTIIKKAMNDGIPLCNHCRAMQDNYVYTADYETQYHTYYCSGVKDSRNHISLLEALEQGYEMCDKCKAPYGNK